MIIFYRGRIPAKVSEANVNMVLAIARNLPKENRIATQGDKKSRKAMCKFRGFCVIDTKCAICNSADFRVKYNASFDESDVKSETFSTRKPVGARGNPHYRIVECKKCGLVYSNPILEPKVIDALYAGGRFEYSREKTAMLRRSYGQCIAAAAKFLKRKGRFLDVGCGNGFLLEEALEQGFEEVHGLEPNKHCIKIARHDIRHRIVNDTLKPDSFKKNYFDLISFFFVLDHVPDPNRFIQQCRGFLKKGGVILCVSHNARALPAKILGEKSPIIDLSHIYLFDNSTIKKIFEKNGFQTRQQLNVLTTHSLQGWLDYLALPDVLRRPLKFVLQKTGLGNARLSVRAGNFGYIGAKH